MSEESNEEELAREGADQINEEKDEDRLEQNEEEREREGDQHKRLQLAKVKEKNPTRNRIVKRKE